MMKKHPILKYLLLFSVFCFLFSGPLAFAAEVFFEQEKNLGLKDQFRMGIFLKTEEPLNAIEGKINFPVDLLELKNIQDGNSVINLWLERPNADERGEITFSGITPGGYQGDKGLIFSMTFLVRQEGVGTFDIHDARLLRNDGKGTEAKLQAISSKFVISRKTTEVQIPVSEIEDADPPESFAPEIAKDIALFDGRWFVVFATQDKASGVDHYKIKESRQKFFTFFSKWEHAESPHVLQDQKLGSYVFVKAVDKGGNERVVALPPQKLQPWYENYFILVILITGSVIAGIIFRKFLWQKFIK